jgi:heme-degrading monooxygenase HmoA
VLGISRPAPHHLPMMVILFRSRLTSAAGADYQALDSELEGLVKENPGYVSHKAYLAEDGERLALVWFKDEESLRAWKTQPRHAEAQRRGQERWYEHYTLDVAQVVRTTRFQKPGGAAPP